jgi:hypothetical protein
MKKAIAMSVFAAVLFGVASESMAACASSWAKVNYMHRRSQDTYTQVFTERHSHSGNGALQWFWTNQADLKDLLSDALNDGTTVWVVGNRSSCGSLNTSSPQWSGYIQSVEAFRNR